MYVWVYEREMRERVKRKTYLSESMWMKEKEREKEGKEEERWDISHA